MVKQHICVRSVKCSSPVFIGFKSERKLDSVSRALGLSDLSCTPPFPEHFKLHFVTSCPNLEDNCIKFIRTRKVFYNDLTRNLLVPISCCAYVFTRISTVNTRNIQSYEAKVRNCFQPGRLRKWFSIKSPINIQLRVIYRCY